jgi:uncharacterized RDD family membrane protein YckC
MPSSDKLAIDTPEQIVLELPLAGIGSRLLAFVFDTLLQLVVFFVVFLVLAVGVTWLAPAMRMSWLPAFVVVPGLILLVFCLYWGYFAVFEIVWKGQTPGKRYAGIRVIQQTGRSINVFEGIARNLLRAVDALPMMYGVGLVCMILNKQNRRIGDYVAGTVVVHDRAMEEVRPSWSAPAEPSAVRAEVTKLAADDLVLIETYLQRRFELDPAVRTARTERIVRLVAAKTGLQPAPDQTSDDFLEAIAREMRDTARFR